MTLRSTAREHADISALIPWYVNDTIGEDERRRVDLHLAACPKCRLDLAEQRRVHEAMSRDTAIEYMPAASLNRLRARLDGIDGARREEPAPRRRIPGVSWHGLMAASVALMAVALSFLAAERFQSRAHRGADYYTVTAPVPRPASEVIRAVFAPTVTLAELQGILVEAQLRIVAGPTEAGVYSLAQTDPHGAVSSSLALLRGHAKVRFAESTQVDPAPGAKPSGPSRVP
jgi:putative zinc finger protein